MSVGDGDARLGAGVVQRLLPHRRPMLMVDAITAVGLLPQLSIRAVRLISANDPVFDGHFPGLAIWPGCLLVEGLAQACNLHVALAAVVREYEARGRTARAALRDLRALDERVRLHAPAHATKGPHERLEEVLCVAPARGLLAAVDVELTAPVVPGDVVEYAVEPERIVDRVARFQVCARIGRRTVGRGRLSFAIA